MVQHVGVKCLTCLQWIPECQRHTSLQPCSESVGVGNHLDSPGVPAKGHTRHIYTHANKQTNTHTYKHIGINIQTRTLFKSEYSDGYRIPHPLVQLLQHNSNNITWKKSIEWNLCIVPFNISLIHNLFSKNITRSFVFVISFKHSPSPELYSILSFHY